MSIFYHLEHSKQKYGEKPLTSHIYYIGVYMNKIYETKYTIKTFQIMITPLPQVT